MSRKMFKLCTVVITMIVAALIAWAITTGNALIPIPAVIAGVVILYLFRRGVKEVVEDERIYRIADKASRRTVQILGILMAVAGATLIAVSRSGSPSLEQAGYALAYSVCAMLVIYYITYIYYNRKFGGKE